MNDRDPALESVRDSLRQLLVRNTKDGYSRLLNRHYCYVAPALGTYPYQWFWDTCFHVIMLARLGEHELAKRNLRSLFEMQEDDGFVGHMVFWNQALPHRASDILQSRPSPRTVRPHMSALIQPCLAAQALLALFEACGDRVFLGELYAKVLRYHEWLAAHRDFDGDGLLTIISPFESGMDWKPSYDVVLGHSPRVTPRRLYTSGLYWKVVGVDAGNFVSGYDAARIRRRQQFLVKDAGFNAVYARDLQAMEALAKSIGDDAERWAQRRRRVVQSMMDVLYDEKMHAFLDVQEPGSRKIPVLTPTIFFPLASDLVAQDLAESMVRTHLEHGDGFKVRWPMPSVQTSDPAFFAGQTPFLWRGPTWSFINWFLFKAFDGRGMAEQAQALRKSLRELVERSGFREYYDPLEGKGLGAKDFTWSGLLVDM
jgi:glycogen debranching enzyme